MLFLLLLPSPQRPPSRSVPLLGGAVRPLVSFLASPSHKNRKRRTTRELETSTARHGGIGFGVAVGVGSGLGAKTERERDGIWTPWSDESEPILAELNTFQEQKHEKKEQAVRAKRATAVCRNISLAAASATGSMAECLASKVVVSPGDHNMACGSAVGVVAFSMPCRLFEELVLRSTLPRLTRCTRLGLHYCYGHRELVGGVTVDLKVASKVLLYG